MLWGLLPPVLVSAPFLVGMFDGVLARYRNSALGRYVARSMTRAMEALRLLGLLGLWVGAWYHQPRVIALGLGLVALAWLRGRLWPPGGSTPVGARPAGGPSTVP